LAASNAPNDPNIDRPAWLKKATELFADSLEQTHRPAAQVRIQQESHRFRDGPGISVLRGRLEADLGGSNHDAKSIVCED
jgi:hypothetical protein